MRYTDRRKPKGKTEAVNINALYQKRYRAFFCDMEENLTEIYGIREEIMWAEERFLTKNRKARI